MSSPIGALFVAKFLMQDQEEHVWRVRKHLSEVERRSGTRAEASGRLEEPNGPDHQGRRLRLRARHV